MFVDKVSGNLPSTTQSPPFNYTLKKKAFENIFSDKSGIMDLNHFPGFASIFWDRPPLRSFFFVSIIGRSLYSAIAKRNLAQ